MSRAKFWTLNRSENTWENIRNAYKVLIGKPEW